MMKKRDGKITASQHRKHTTVNDVLVSAARKKFIKLCKNEQLYRQNEPIKGIYYLITGKIEIVQKDKEEKYHILHLVKAPDIIGLSSVLCDELHTNSAYSVQESNILFIPKKNFLELLNQNKQVAIDLMKNLCSKIDKTEARIPQIIR
ncbi:MAG: Crp/Fnr family transcriptional regulator [Ignavibacteria bacterium]